ncbi:MAG: hypothetical protein K9W43_03485 [Candidatus Thorarchaeota archaeon]|nr:hypothetical protein [Candidatus Thorarchaeota archaeon]
MYVYQNARNYTILFILFIGLSFLSLGAEWQIAAHQQIYHQENELRDTVLGIATNLMNVDETFIIDQCELLGVGEPIWNIRWIGPENELVEIHLSAKDYTLLSLFDGRTYTSTCSPAAAITTSDTAVMIAESYLQQLHENGHFTIPLDRVLSDVRNDGALWKIVWFHAIDSIPIVGDHLIVQLDRTTRSLISIDLSWSPVPMVAPIRHAPSYQEMVRIAGISALADIIGPHEQLVSSRNDHCLIPVWKYSEINNGVELLSISISAYTGNVVNIDGPRSYYGFAVVSDGGTDFEESADWADFTLDADNYLPNRQSQPTVSTMSYYWSWENVIVYIGHGGFSGSYTVLAPQGPNGDLFYPSDIPSNMNQAILVYASACQSGCYAAQESSVHLYLSNTSLNNGAEAFFGWIGSPTNSEATTFDKYFWSAAANGASFKQCRDYANGKISSSANPIVHGNAQAHLEKKDVSWNYYLGSAPYREDATLKYDDENAFYTDYDYFRFDVTGTHEITIMVVPSRSEFDVGFKVYSSSYQLLYTVNSRGGGGYERITYSGSGTYHIKVYIANGGLGGVYDLKVTCAAS